MNINKNKKKNWDASRVCEDVCEEKVNLGGSELSFL